MATGDHLVTWSVLGNQPPATGYATFDTRNSVPVLDFDAAASEAAIFSAILPSNYGGGSLVVDIDWMASTATSGAVVWETAFERMNTDLDADSFATGLTATATTSGTSGILTRTSITHSSAQIDGLQAGEPFRLRLQRLGANASDTMTGDAEAALVRLREA